MMEKDPAKLWPQWSHVVLSTVDKLASRLRVNPSGFFSWLGMA
jgi:hypothetical protein